MEKCAANAFTIVIHLVMGVNFSISAAAIGAVPIFEASQRWAV